MIKNLIKIYFQVDNNDKFYFFILSLFPLALIFGNLIINLFIFFLVISFFINLKKNLFFINNKIIYLLGFFLLSLIINIFFSLIPENSLPRVLKIFFILLITVDTARVFNRYNEKIISNIFLVWSLVFLIVIFDCIFEIIFGFNTLGFSTSLTGRIASFFGDELIVGAYVHGFALVFLAYLVYKNSNNYFLFFCILSIIVVSFLIGERSNFMKLFFSIMIFTFVGVKIKYIYKLSSFVLISLFIIGFLNFNKDYKYRYYYQIEALFKKDGLSNFYKNSQYGAHQNTAIKIFFEYPSFGVGIKNFRYESIKEKYHNEEYKSSNARQATHPHQVHLEFLSETGIFGYVSFLIFILSSIIICLKNYLKNRNIFQLACLIFIFTSLFPLIPSGSFLSTFNSGIFWINYLVMIGLYKNLYSKF